MKIRLADYVADFLVEHGVTDVFSVVGGGAMYLNDAFGHHEGLKVTYNHHEQACAIAAEAYARLDNRIAAVCVTTGPGGINALTGVAGGYVDSIPMFIVSGQVRHDTTAKYGMQFTDGMPLRSLGDQEYNIVDTVKPMTKYSVMLENPEDIRYELEKCWHIATHGRPGPVWLDIPVDYQNANIAPETLRSYSCDEDVIDNILPVSDHTLQSVLDELKKSKRPVIYAGFGIRLADGYEAFKTAIIKLNVPVVTYWNAIDLIETEHPLYVGRAGNMGDRPGNWAIQNADLIIAVGTRLSTRQTGLAWKTWAREAKTLFVNVDIADAKKHTLHDVTPVKCDAKNFFEKINSMVEVPYTQHQNWVNMCQEWKKQYPVLQQRQKEQKDLVNVYYAFDYISRQLPENSLTVVSNGACCVAGHQTWYIKNGSRFHNNNGIASMGYGLPAAIGACISSGKKTTICLEGDGSIMMNLQELQTMKYYNLPIKLFLVNNSGYQSIRITQTNLFNKNFTGIDPQTGVGLPEYKKIADAFGISYCAIHDNKELERLVPDLLNQPGSVFVELFTDTQQVWEPKSSAKRLPNGTLTSPPLEDLAPFISKDELKQIMQIPMV